MMRVTLADVRQSALPRSVGLCAADLPRIAEYVNEATERLLYASGETGWYGCWQRVVFQVSTSNPYITLPRQFSRIINLTACNYGLRIRNEFYEMIPGGVGLMPQLNTTPDWFSTTIEGYERGLVPTMVDLTPTNQLLRAYITDARDEGSRMLITGKDQNGLDIYTDDGQDTVNGTYLSFLNPLATTAFSLSSISLVQKDVTFGDVVLKQVDQTTGEEVTLSRFSPTETAPAYRRYYITKLPASCCASGTPSATVSITALAKLEYAPVYLDTDALLISNIPALIEECMAIRYSRTDGDKGKAHAAFHHKSAIRQLQNQMRHYLGEQSPAVKVDVYQGAPLSRVMRGSRR